MQSHSNDSKLLRPNGTYFAITFLIFGVFAVGTILTTTSNHNRIDDHERIIASLQQALAEQNIVKLNDDYTVSPVKPVKISRRSGITETSNEVEIVYGEYDNLPLSLIINKSGGPAWLELSLPKSTPTAFHDKYLNALKMEVLSFMSGEVQHLGLTGVKVSWGDGYPVWGPSSSMLRDRYTENLIFSYDAIYNREEKVITINGQEKPVGFYGYEDWKPNS